MQLFEKKLPIVLHDHNTVLRHRKLKTFQRQQSVHIHQKQQKQKVLFRKYISAHKLQLERSPKKLYGYRENN